MSGVFPLPVLYTATVTKELMVILFPAAEHHYPLASIKSYYLPDDRHTCVNNLLRVIAGQGNIVIYV